MESNVERELGRLTEAVSGLKESQREGFLDLRREVIATNKKLDQHLSNYAETKYAIGKIAGTVALIVSMLLGVAKTAVAKLFGW